MDDLANLSDERLAEDICTWAGRVAAGTARLLALVAEFDRREAWGGPGLLSCAHWLSWRIGLSPGTGREWVRVARRLEELPPIRAAFQAGQMSWSQVRAITRVATMTDGVDWVDLARHSSAAQLERIVRGLRRVHQSEAANADPETAAYRLRTRTRYDDDGNLVLTIYVPAEDAPVILAGLEAQRAELAKQRAAQEPEASAAVAEEPSVPAEALPRLQSVPPETPAPPRSVPAETPTPQNERCVSPLTPEALASYFSYVDELSAEQVWDDGRPEEPVAAASADVPAETPQPAVQATATAATAARPRVTDAEALVALARRALDEQQASDPGLARRNRARLVAHVDPLSGWARLHDGELLPPCTLGSVLKTLPGRGGVVRLRPLTQADLTRHDLGRDAREANLPLRELLGALDGERCRFPGCTRHRKLHAHHVVYWADGGRTDLANLVLVCSRHHTLIHKQGFQLQLDADRRLTVMTPEGVQLMHHPAQPWGDPAALDPRRRVSAGTLSPTDTDARMDLGYVVDVLLRQAS